MRLNHIVDEAVLRRDERAREPVAYSTMEGTPWRQPIWQVLLHVVNHGTHHRGQVSGFLRTLGHTPPVTDLICFYRQW